MPVLRKDYKTDVVGCTELVEELKILLGVASRVQKNRAQALLRNTSTTPNEIRKLIAAIRRH